MTLACNRARILFASLVLISACTVALPQALSQSYSTVTISSTSSALYTYPISTSAQSVTTAIYQSNVQLSAWHIPGCAVDIPFTAMPGDLISASFSSNVPIDFHIISAGPRFSGIADVFCGFGIPPGSLQEISYRTSYSVQWTPSEAYYLINKVTQYFLVLDNWQTASASVYLSAQETPSQMVTTTISATSTLMHTILATQILSNTQPLATATSTRTSQSPQILQWQALLAIIPVILIVALLWRRSRKHVEKTRVY